MHNLILATSNRHKTREFREMLGDLFEISDLSRFPDIPPIEETGKTFEENATLKAVEISRRLDGCVLADDSGLEVDALGGRPGVYSARYSGPEANDASNRKKLLAELAGFGDSKDRTARFKCVLVLAKNGEPVFATDGKIEGTIAFEDSGTIGFGYDPVFIPEGHTETFGCIDPQLKNQLSHRANAVTQFRRIWLEGLFERPNA